MTARDLTPAAYREMIERLLAKIARMEKGKTHSEKREARLRDENQHLQQQLAELEIANDRLVENLLEARRPLLTDEEDEAGTEAMAKLEMRG